MLTGTYFYSLTKPLTVRPRVCGALIVMVTAAVISDLFDFGLTGNWKWVAGALIAGPAVAGTAGALAWTANAKKTLFWPLALCLAAGTGIFGAKQLLIDAGRIHQIPEVVILRADAIADLPLFFWTLIVGILWAWTASDRAAAPGETATTWFRFWDDRPALIWSALGFITLAAAIIRFWGLGGLGLWSDEGIVYIAAQNILKTGLPYLETKFLYPRDLPHLYAVAAVMWFSNDVEFSVRLPSAIAGVILVPVTFLLARRLFEQRTAALLAAAIVAVHPWMIEYSRFGRSYMMMLLWLYLAVYFFQTGLTSRWSRVGLATVGLLSALTHQIGQMALMLAILALMKKEWRAEPRKWWPFLGAFAGVAAYKILFSYGYYFYQDGTANVTAREAVARRIPLGLPRFDNLLVFMRVAPFFLLIAMIVAFARARWLGLKALGYFYYTSWFIIIMTSFLLSKKFISLNRGILFFFPLLALATALFILYATTLLRSRTGRTAIGVLLVGLFVAYGAYGFKIVATRDYGSKVNPNFAPFDGFTYFHDNKTPIEYVSRRRRPGDQIIILAQPNYWVPYSDIRPDWRIWSGSSITYKRRNIFVGTPETGDLDEFDNLLRGKRTWIVTSFSIKWGNRIGHIAPYLAEYLNSYSGQRVYVSKDPTAMVFLIDRRTEKKTRHR